MNLLSRLIATATVAATVTLAGCSTSQKIQVVQPGDNNLSCAGLKEEMAKLMEDDNHTENQYISRRNFTGYTRQPVIIFLRNFIDRCLSQPSHNLFLVIF